jgi:hypothetical protein
MAVKVLLAFCSSAALICFSIYIYLANRGRSPYLYFPTNGRMPIPIGKKVFLAFAAIALLVCIYAGSELMLFWIPKTWGSLDEDGDFVTTQFLLASLFTTFGGIALGIFIEKSIQNQFDNYNLAIECEELERILKASVSESQLKYLVQEYESKRADLISKYLENDSDKFYGLPQAKTAMVYKYLIEMTETLLSKLHGAKS